MSARGCGPVVPALVDRDELDAAVVGAPRGRRGHRAVGRRVRGPAPVDVAPERVHIGNRRAVDDAEARAAAVGHQIVRGAVNVNDRRRAGRRAGVELDAGDRPDGREYVGGARQRVGHDGAVAHAAGVDTGGVHADVAGDVGDDRADEAHVVDALSARAPAAGFPVDVPCLAETVRVGHQEFGRIGQFIPAVILFDLCAAARHPVHHDHQGGRGGQSAGQVQPIGAIVPAHVEVVHAGAADEARRHRGTTCDDEHDPEDRGEPAKHGRAISRWRFPAGTRCRLCGPRRPFRKPPAPQRL